MDRADGRRRRPLASDFRGKESGKPDPEEQLSGPKSLYSSHPGPFPDPGPDAGQHDQHHRVCQLHPAGKHHDLQLCHFDHVSWHVPGRDHPGPPGRPMGAKGHIDRLAGFDRHWMRGDAALLSGFLGLFAGKCSGYPWSRLGRKWDDLYESCPIRLVSQRGGRRNGNLWIVPGSFRSLWRGRFCSHVYQSDYRPYSRQDGCRAQ